MRRHHHRNARRCTRSVEVDERTSILSAIEEADSRITVARGDYLGAVAEGLQAILRLYWHSLAHPPMPRGRQLAAKVKPGRSTIKDLLSHIPDTLEDRNALAKALYAISVEGPHNPDLAEDVTNLANSLCLTYCKHPTTLRLGRLRGRHGRSRNV